MNNKNNVLNDDSFLHSIKEPSRFVKFLGIKVQDTLIWRQHTLDLILKLIKAFDVILTHKRMQLTLIQLCWCPVPTYIHN